MRSKSQSVGILLLGMALFLGLQGFGMTVAAKTRRVPVPRNPPRQRRKKRRKSASASARGVKMELVLIQPGSFMMGDDKGDAEEKPVHKVTISKPFYMGKYEVTQEQWEAVMGANPSHFKGPQNPVDRVSWEACQTFVKKLNEKFAASGVTFALPTEAQWEYACRAGSSRQYGFRRRGSRTRGIRLVRGQRRRQNASGGREETECLGIVRHARQRLAVVRRLVRWELLQGIAHDRPKRTGGRHVARAARRLVERPGPLLPLVVPLLPPALVLRPLLRRPRGVPLIREHLETPRSKDRGRQPCGNCSRTVAPGVAAPKPHPGWRAGCIAL